MADAKHTPGPWAVGEQNGHCGISINEPSGDGARVATVYLGLVTSCAKWGEEHFALPENAEALANANLIAAAPELLEALEAVLKEIWADWHSHMTREDFDKHFASELAAITKARGETE